MAVTNYSVELLQQRRIGDWQHLARRRFYIEGESSGSAAIGLRSGEISSASAKLASFAAFSGFAKVRPIQQQLVSFSPGQVRKSDRRGRAFKGQRGDHPILPRSRRRFPVIPRRPCSSRDIARRSRRDRSGSFSPPVRELSADTRWVTALLRHDQPIETSRATDNRTSAESCRNGASRPLEHRRR